jgi:hypothetical protein
MPAAVKAVLYSYSFWMPMAKHRLKRRLVIKPF